MRRIQYRWPLVRSLSLNCRLKLRRPQGAWQRVRRVLDMCTDVYSILCTCARAYSATITTHRKNQWPLHRSVNSTVCKVLPYRHNFYCHSWYRYTPQLCIQTQQRGMHLQILKFLLGVWSQEDWVIKTSVADPEPVKRHEAALFWWNRTYIAVLLCLWRSYQPILYSKLYING
jgi:hypothetical protein